MFGKINDFFGLEKGNSSQEEINKNIPKNVREEFSTKITQKLEGRLFQGGEKADGLGEDIFYLLSLEVNVLSEIINSFMKRVPREKLKQDQYEILERFRLHSLKIAEFYNTFISKEKNQKVWILEAKKILNDNFSFYTTFKQMGFFQDSGNISKTSK